MLSPHYIHIVIITPTHLTQRQIRLLLCGTCCLRSQKKQKMLFVEKRDTRKEHGKVSNLRFHISRQFCAGILLENKAWDRHPAKLLHSWTYWKANFQIYKIILEGEFLVFRQVAKFILVYLRLLLLLEVGLDDLVRSLPTSTILCDSTEYSSLTQPVCRAPFSCSDLLPSSTSFISIGVLSVQVMILGK